MINYQNIQNSIEFFADHGFKRIESPWTVTEAISNITKPADKKQSFLLQDKKKVLVASGEQSFLYLMLKGFLPKGKFQTVTPCFRDDSFDITHTKYFIKNELIITEDVTKDRLLEVVHQATEFFKYQFPIASRNLIDSKYVNGGNQIDINCCNIIELGSYGIRQSGTLTWIYGTACAEPRLSYCQAHIQGNINAIDYGLSCK